ncbi:MAG TPA: hypothetical protein VFL59_15010 [Candidatus Nanopelagicales bacterium]|nr:hypothetical protein [Candidatus Nanopelagicales bacterium]
MHRVPALLAVVCLAGLPLAALSGCGSSGAAGTPTASAVTTTPASPSAVSPSPVDTAGTTPPTATSTIPDGVYRTRLTASDLTRLGIEDAGNAGTWTLTISKGSYFLRCAPTTAAGTDCGQDDEPGNVLVEVGWVRGTGSTVWFVHDPARTQTMTGCNHQCPMGGYRMTWRADPRGLMFSDYVGLGDEAGPVLGNWVSQPWTRIS